MLYFLPALVLHAPNAGPNMLFSCFSHEKYRNEKKQKNEQTVQTEAKSMFLGLRPSTVQMFYSQKTLFESFLAFSPFYVLHAKNTKEANFDQGLVCPATGSTSGGNSQVSQKSLEALFYHLLLQLLIRKGCLG